MTIILLRHARAGRRSTGDGDDRARPLDADGRAQAAALAERLAGRRITQIATSPAARCVETVEPLAAAIGARVDVVDELLEGSDPTGVIRLMESHTDGDLVLSTHGDLVPRVIDLLQRRGMVLGPDTGNDKAGYWCIEPGPQGFESARYEPPPR